MHQDHKQYVIAVPDNLDLPDWLMEGNIDVRFTTDVDEADYFVSFPHHTASRNYFNHNFDVTKVIEFRPYTDLGDTIQGRRVERFSDILEEKEGTASALGYYSFMTFPRFSIASMAEFFGVKAPGEEVPEIDVDSDEFNNELQEESEKARTLFTDRGFTDSIPLMIYPGLLVKDVVVEALYDGDASEPRARLSFDIEVILGYSIPLEGVEDIPIHQVTHDITLESLTLEIMGMGQGFPHDAALEAAQKILRRRPAHPDGTTRLSVDYYLENGMGRLINDLEKLIESHYKTMSGPCHTDLLDIANHLDRAVAHLREKGNKTTPNAQDTPFLDRLDKVKERKRMKALKRLLFITGGVIILILALMTYALSQVPKADEYALSGRTVTDTRPCSIMFPGGERVEGRREYSYSYHQMFGYRWFDTTAVTEKTFLNVTTGGFTAVAQDIGGEYTTVSVDKGEFRLLELPNYPQYTFIRNGEIVVLPYKAFCR